MVTYVTARCPFANMSLARLSFCIYLGRASWRSFWVGRLGERGVDTVG